jgi:Transposase DDE domain
MIVHYRLGVAVDGDLCRLAAFRRDMYEGCFVSWRDCQFELVDALAGAARRVSSIAELMLEPASRRGWGSLYQALEHGGVDAVAAGELLAGQVCAGGLPVMMFAVDVSKMPRPDTRMVADVGMQYAAERDGHGGVPAIPGWAMQWVAQVGLDGPAAVSSWALPVHVQRVGTGDNANEVAAGQIADVAARVRRWQPGAVPLFVLDCGYCPVYLSQQRPIWAQILVRLRSDRVFFAAPATRAPGTIGRPRKHGRRFALDEPDTWGPPDAEHVTDRPGVTVRTRAWHGLHPQPRQRRKWDGVEVVAGTLIRREAIHPSGHVQVWWLWWTGPADAFDLPTLADAYRHRFTIEHTFRFVKQDLFWTGHTPLDPDQAERWTWLVALAYTQLHLARGIVADRRLPWEKHLTVDRLSPRRVRRGFRAATAQLPTPARAPKPSRPGPGRPKGSKNVTVRTRRPVIKKPRAANTGQPKGKNPPTKTTQP